MSIRTLHNRTESALAPHADIGLLVLRLIIGAHLVWKTQDNVFSWDRMIKFRDFLAKFDFPWPLASAVLSVAAQFCSGLLLVLGLFTRFAGLVIVINFIVAIWMVDAREPYPAAFAALALVAVGFCLMFTGAGRYSLDHMVRKRR